MNSAINSGSQSLTRVIAQRNTIHHPRSNSNDWTQNHPEYSTIHPEGPQAICFHNSDGNHVFRYNHCYSDSLHRFNDILGGSSNGSDRGFPNCNTDIYGNILETACDDAIESEGANKNVRIWGNYINNYFQAVATRSTSKGPIYIWSNVIANRGKFTGTMKYKCVFHKGGWISEDWGDYGVYDFHNTMLQPSNGGAEWGIHGLMKYTASAKNINIVLSHQIVEN